MTRPRDGAVRVARSERLLVFGAAALFLYLALFRDGVFVYQFHKTSSGAWIDEGIRAARGELIFRDFDETIGPGLVYLNAALVRLFGARLDAFACAGLGLGALLTASIHGLAGSVVATRWRLLPPLTFLLLVFAPSELVHTRWPALLFGLMGAAICASRADRAGALRSGLAVGVAVLFARGIGVGIGLGLLLLIASDRTRRQTLSAFLAGATAPVALVMGALAVAAGPWPVIDAWLIRPSRQAWPDPSLLLQTSWHARPVAQLVLACAAAAGGAWLLRGLRGQPDAVRVLGFAGFGLLAGAPFGIIDAHTLAVHATLLSVLLAAALQRLGFQQEGPRKWLGPALVGALLPGLVHGSLGLIVRRQWLDALVRQRFRAGEAWLATPMPELLWLESRTRPGDYVFAFPAGGLFYGLTQTRNATSFPYMIEGRFSEAQQRQALAEIAARRPAVGVWLAAQRFPPPAGAATLDTLYDGLLETYAVERVLPTGTLLLSRRPGPGEAPHDARQLLEGARIRKALARPGSPS